MPDLLARLTSGEQARFLEELNYLNLEEIRGFCSRCSIPYRIVIAYPDGTVRATKDTDRKPVVLARVRRYLTTGDAGPPTHIVSEIAREAKPPTRLLAHNRLYYRWYAKEHEGVLRRLRLLTGGQFKDGAVARVLAMKFWTRGEAPTLEEFARAWTRAKGNQHRLLTAEYAYLTDVQRGRADGNWKAVRKAKAASALKTLARLTRRSD